MPIEEPARFSLKGAKWLLFLAGCIYGDFDGHLSLSSAGDAIDYDAPLHATTYHFVSDKQPRFLDPKLTDARTSVKSATTRTGDFRDNLIARDRHCLVNDTKPVDECDAVHLLPRAKGNSYITAATVFRSDNQKVIENIDDSRNGLLLAKELHTHLGLGHLAFLMTPNPVLDVNDISPSPVERPGDTRVTVHYLRTHRYTLDHGYDLRLPDNGNDLSNFPPSLILDQVYAASFVAYWGNQDSIGQIAKQVFSRYYRQDRDEDEDEDGKGLLTMHESTDPLLLKGKGSGNALGNALDFLLLFQKYCVQGAGPTEERLEKEEQAKRRTESIEKIQGWKARTGSTV